MSIGIETFEFVPVLVARLAEKEVVAVLTHPTALVYQFFAVKALILLFLVKLGLKHGFKFVVGSMGLGVVHFLVSGPFEKAFLTYALAKRLHSLKFLQVVQLKQTPIMGF